MKFFLLGLRAELFSLHSWVIWPYLLAHSTLAMCSLLSGSERRTPLAPQSLLSAPLGFSLPYICSCYPPLLPHLSPASVWILLSGEELTKCCNFLFLPLLHIYPAFSHGLLWDSQAGRKIPVLLPKGSHEPPLWAGLPITDKTSRG